MRAPNLAEACSAYRWPTPDASWSATITMSWVAPYISRRLPVTGTRLLALEANTALGDNLFAYLAVLLRWEFMGDLTTEGGMPVRASPDGPAATLHAFAPGARLGLTYTF